VARTTVRSSATLKIAERIRELFFMRKMPPLQL
jgi:hypothetical protein